ncbi:unnamed protein product [Haemonchus placei]|uniref:Ground-like domain-containing protein n=1 Tax=Haemonchus placei TaxID=6290 RepID=A0A0N4WJY3_HAEPC|nr:unnamed protein product [Haemonchus placei]
MAFSYTLCLSLILAMAITTESLFFGGGGGGGGCCGGCGRKKRSVCDYNLSLCKYPELFFQNMASDPAKSKFNLVNALYLEGDHFFVVCTTGDSLYSAPRSSIFCSASSFNHTCYVFGV